MYQKAADYLPEDGDSWKIKRRDIWTQLGELAHQGGRYEQSIQSYNKALELTSYADSGLYARLAAVYADMDESQKVLEMATLWLQHLARNYQLDSSMGAIYQAGKHYERAIECFRHTIEQSLRERDIEYRTRGVVERRLVECYLQTGRKEEAAALQAQMVDTSPVVVEPDAYEQAEYLLRLRWVEAPPTAEVKGDAIIADGSEPDEEFIAKLSKTLQGAQLHLGVTLPLKKGRKVSVLLPYDFEPYDAYSLEMYLGKREEGHVSLHLCHYRECEGINRGGWTTGPLSYPPGETRLFFKQILTLDGGLEVRYGQWPVREGIGKIGGDDCPITEMHPNALRFENRVSGERAFYLFLTILENNAPFFPSPHPFTQLPPSPSHNHPKKEDALRKAIEQSPLDRKPYCELAALYAEMGESEKAAALADEFAMARVRHVAERGALGGIYKAGKQYEKAVEQYQRALALRPYHATSRVYHMTGVQLNLIECLEQLGRQEEAEKVRQSIPEKFARMLGKPAPDFSLRDATGKRHRLADYKGRVVLLNCIPIPCGSMQVMPYTERLHRRYKSKGLTVLGLTKETDLIKVQEFMRERISFPVLMDVDEVIEAYYDTVGATFIRIIDKTGIVRYRYDGMGLEKIEQKLKALLAETF